MAEANLLTQTALLRFGPVRIPQVDMLLWCRTRPTPSAKYMGRKFATAHLSSYHLFHATARMVVNPGMHPNLPRRSVSAHPCPGVVSLKFV